MSKLIVGYSDQISVAPGETVRFMVSCQPEVSRYDAAIVRMVSGDAQPGGPGLKQEPVPTEVNGSYPARRQPIHAGSYVRIEDHAAFDTGTAIGLTATICPTMLDRPKQVLFDHFDPVATRGFELFIDADGHLAFRIGDAEGGTATFISGEALDRGMWQTVGASFDAGRGEAVVFHATAAQGFGQVRTCIDRFPTSVAGVGSVRRAMTIAASVGSEGPVACFNGRMERPAIAAVAFDLEAARALRTAPTGERHPETLLALWDFSLRPSVRPDDQRKRADEHAGLAEDRPGGTAPQAAA